MRRKVIGAAGISALAVLVLSLVSCDAILTGSSLVKQIDEKIAYESAPSYEIQFSSTYGKISPDGKNNYKVTDTKPLSFSEDTDYKFVEWKIKDKKTGKDLTKNNYINIENLYEDNTSFTFEKAPEEGISLLVEAVCIRRPRVVSSTPAYDSDGVFRDRRITVMFDQKIDRETIYYSLEERNEIKELNEGKIINWLCTDEQEYADVYSSSETRNFYGYKIDNDDDSIVFKCMTISKLNDQNANLLKHYRVPELDESNTAVLRLSPKKYVKNNDQLPPTATDILVNITKDFGCTTKTSAGKTVLASLSSVYPWSYYTNSRYDDTPPKFEDGFKVYLEKGGVKSLAEYTESNKNSVSTETPSNTNRVKNKIWISGKITDGGSGPKALKATITRLSSSYYSDIGNGSESSEDLNLEVIGSTGELKDPDGETGYELDLSKYDQGFYSISFTASDKNEQITKYSKTFYFLWDNKGPVIPEKMERERLEAGNVKMKWKEPSEKDYNKIKVKTEKVTGAETSLVSNIEFSGTAGKDFSGQISSLTNLTKYKHTVYFFDILGNSSEYEFPLDNTSPKVPESISELRTAATFTTLTWTDPSEKDYSQAVVKTQKVSGEGTNSVADQTFNKVSGVHSEKITGLENLTKYKHTVTFYDYDGNASEYEFPLDNTPPKVPESISELRTAATFTTLTWTEPSETDYSQAVIKTQKVSGAGTNSVADQIFNKVSGVRSGNITGLENLTKYKHTVTFYDYDGNASEYEVLDNTPPDPREHFFLGVKENCLKGLADFAEGTDCYKVSTVFEGNEEELLNTSANIYAEYNYKGLINGTVYEVKAKAVDFSGNVSEVVSIKETPGARLGLICYVSKSKGLLCSDNIYKKEVTPIGVVCGVPSDKTKVRVWDIKDDNEARTFCGVYPSNVSVQADDGLSNYNSLKSISSSNTVMKHLESINGNSPVTWYLPAFNEMKTVCDNRVNEKIKNAYYNLKTAIKIEDAVYLYEGSNTEHQMYSQCGQFVSDGISKKSAGMIYMFYPQFFSYSAKGYLSGATDLLSTETKRINHYMCQVDLSDPSN